ncbi:MAG: M48 family metallopeptidase, partial [Alphaproteobacteria bacterium]|nr:M48 family metallopeptidase [Alphaproteobacteria bacterium]
IIPGEKEFSARRVEDFIKRETKKILALRAGYYAAQLGVSFRSIALRESSSRWGSCSAGGGLSFCWRLAFAPFAVMDYVVAHEVAHLRHHHHGTAFWQAVETLYPGYEKQENWLKRHGQSVWQWG